MMKYFILYSDNEYEYSFLEKDTYEEAVECVEQQKKEWNVVFVIKGTELKIKTNYSLEE